MRRTSTNFTLVRTWRARIYLLWFAGRPAEPQRVAHLKIP